MSTPVYGWQYEVLSCPFCKEGEISCMWYPSAVTVKANSTASLPGKGSLSKSKETWIVKSGCSRCGKSRDDVERELAAKGMI